MEGRFDKKLCVDKLSPERVFYDVKLCFKPAKFNRGQLIQSEERTGSASGSRLEFRERYGCAELLTYARTKNARSPLKERWLG